MKNFISHKLDDLRFSLAKASARSRAAKREELLSRGTGSMLAIGFIALTLLTGFVAGGHYSEMKATKGTPLDILARVSGFSINQILVTGERELTAGQILTIADVPASSSLPFVDIAAIQARLKAIPLIGEVSVQKFYPNRIVIVVQERAPYALWQDKDKIHIIAEDGTVIEEMRGSKYLHLPHIVGAGANKRAKEYVGLLQEAGGFAKEIRAATLVSERRWNVKLKSGLNVQLPEYGAAEAIRKLAALETEIGLTSRDIIAVDLRETGRVALRLSEDAAQNRNEIMKMKILAAKVRG